MTDEGCDHSTPSPIDGTTLPPGRSPQHVAIIMDGNGRWATRQGLSRIEGHKHGTENIRAIVRAAGVLGVKYLTLWAFSTENWRRPKEEVDGLLAILAHAIESETDELNRQGAQLRHIGDLDALDEELQRSIQDAIQLTSGNEGIVLTLAFNYGGRQELLHAVRKIISEGLPPDDVTEETIADHLFTRDMPDVDLIIRTSGEYRMSNFLLWQGAFAEFFFSPKFWPDFGPDDLREAITDYAQRERRFGAVSAKAIAGTTS
ncbi:MAG: polyprenyl diphosphate synthase [Thermomicrobiales bacterium]